MTQQSNTVGFSQEERDAIFMALAKLEEYFTNAADVNMSEVSMIRELNPENTAAWEQIEEALKPRKDALEASAKDLLQLLEQINKRFEDSVPPLTALFERFLESRRKMDDDIAKTRKQYPSKANPAPEHVTKTVTSSVVESYQAFTEMFTAIQQSYSLITDGPDLKGICATCPARDYCPVSQIGVHVIEIHFDKLPVAPAEPDYGDADKKIDS